MPTRRYGRYTVEADNLDKLFFPDAGVTKGDLIEYYERVADRILPFLKDRPISMERRPDGMDGEGFYQKKAPDTFPDWVDTTPVKLRQGGRERQVVCNKKATLALLAEQGCITPHPWLSRTGALDRPDRMIIDLDPPSEDFAPVRDAARRLRDLLEEVRLKPFLMLTGSKGAHVVVPLDRSARFDTVRRFAQDAAKFLAEKHPDELTTEQRKKKRGRRVFLDTARNAYGQTGVPPYAVRSRKGAPVAAPIRWNELSRGSLRSANYNTRNLFRRLANLDDPWKGMGRSARSLEEPRQRLDDLISREADSG